MPQQRSDWWNQAQREQREFEAWLDRKEAPLARKVARSKNKLIKRISGAYTLSPSRDWLQWQLEHEAEVREILITMCNDVIPKRASLTLDSIRALKRWPNYEGYFKRIVDKWIAQEALNQAVTIAETTMDDVRRVIDKGIMQGLGVAVVAKEIRKVTALSLFRAKVVARTELHNASLYAQEETSKQAEVDFGIKLMKFWIPTLDARTRDAHAAMIGHAGVPVNDKFMVGGEKLSRPGDPAGSAGNVINCRCGMFMRELEFEIE